MKARGSGCSETLSCIICLYFVYDFAWFFFLLERIISTSTTAAPATPSSHGEGHPSLLLLLLSSLRPLLLFRLEEGADDDVDDDEDDWRGKSGVAPAPESGETLPSSTSLTNALSATCKAVRPSLSLAAALAPTASSILTISGRSQIEAMCRGESPSLLGLLMSMSACCSNNCKQTTCENWR